MQLFSLKEWNINQSLLLLPFFVIALFGFINTAEAAPVDLTGWGWSENVGWISFNQANTSTGANHKVTLDTATGNISGYAWSEHIGWISFNGSDVTQCPLLGEDQSSRQARVLNVTAGGTMQVIGWARALAATGNNSEAGGWDGCIHLSSGGSGFHPTGVANGTGGVTLNRIVANGNIKYVFVGYAWGGDDTSGEAVVGWIDFSPFLAKSGYTPPPPPTGDDPVCTGPCGGGTTPSVDVKVNGSDGPVTVTADPGGQATVNVSYVFSNVPSACQATGSGSWPGTKSSSPGSQSIVLDIGSATTPQSFFFNLNCGGPSDRVDLTVNPASGGGTGTVNVSCRAVDPNTGAQTPSVVVGAPVRWEATIELDANNKPGPNYLYTWRSTAGGGFTSGLSGTSGSNVISVDRVYTTTGNKEVWIEITGTGAPNSTGQCAATIVQVKAKPVFEPF